jgi:hypothetical protein
MRQHLLKFCEDLSEQYVRVMLYFNEIYDDGSGTKNPTKQASNMKSTLTHACVNAIAAVSTGKPGVAHDVQKSFVPSRPATRMSSFSPPGWKSR